MNSEISIGSIWTANNLHRRDLVPNVVIISEELSTSLHEVGSVISFCPAFLLVNYAKVT